VQNCVLILVLLVRVVVRNSLELRAEPPEARMWMGSWENRDGEGGGGMNRDGEASGFDI